MDLPPEQILGMGCQRRHRRRPSNGVSHWGAWQVEEATIKLHIEPMLDTDRQRAHDGLPAARAARPARSTWSPTTRRALRLRPDRSKEAFELYDRGCHQVEALLRENGFDPADAPTEDQYQAGGCCRRWPPARPPRSRCGQRWRNSASTWGRCLSGRDHPGVTASPVAGGPPHPTPDPGGVRHCSPPCDAMVFRALERAGNRLRQTGSRAAQRALRTRRTAT